VTKRTRIILAALIAVAALALGGAAIAKSAGVFDDEAPLTGSTLVRAKAAALKATGGGKVNATERDSEQGATYEVEVTKPDGSTVDVRLDSNFAVVAIDGDTESPDDDDSGK
jgi:uncharacterized membrane protein YkoI